MICKRIQSQSHALDLLQEDPVNRLAVVMDKGALVVLTSAVQALPGPLTRGQRACLEQLKAVQDEWDQIISPLLENQNEPKPS